MTKLFLIFFSLSVFISHAISARLNTPRVLLPPNFGAAKNNYTLIVSEGGCYQWSSSRTDLVTVTPLTQECNTKAVVSAVSGTNPPQIAIITAEDPSHNQILRCDVVVDVVSSLEIVTTSRQLFLGDAPTLIEVIGKNEQGDTFSTLDGIEFEWTLVTSGEENTLRFLKFSDSTYQPAQYINALEDQGLQGDKILIEGFKTGSSKVRVRLRDPAYMDVKPAEVTLTVVANVVINPAQDVYLLKHSQIHYRIDLIKDGRAYEVPMPSEEYFLEVEDSSIAKLDRDTSNVTAYEYGHTAIALKDKNVKAAELKQQLSAGIHVVQPSYMVFQVTPGENWALQETTFYEVTIKLYDDRHHRINPSDNLRIDAKFHTKYFKVYQQSQNGTYYVVKTQLPGPTKITAEIRGIETEDGSLYRIQPTVKVTQDVIIYQALQVDPSVILMPWDPIKQTSYTLRLNARGATGFYHWASENPTLATVSFKADEESKTAIVKTLGHGDLNIHIRDAHNSVFKTFARLSIQPVADLEILPTIVEAEIGSDVVIPLALYGFEDVEMKKRKIFNSCSDVPIQVEVVDKAKVEYNPEAKFPAMGQGCRSLAFECKAVGYSRIYVQYDVGDVHLKTTAVVACHKPLKPVYPSRLMLLPIGSTAEVAFEGGPRPWPMNQDGHILNLGERDTSFSSNNILKDPHRFNRDLHIFRVLCKELGETHLEISVGNEKSPTNLNPALLTTSIQLVCGLPETLFLRPVIKGPDGKKLACPIGEEPTRVPVQSYKDLEIDVWAKDERGRKFGNLTSFDISWDLSDYTLAKFDSPRDIISQANGAHGYKKVSRSFRVLSPVGKEGQLKVTAKIIGYRNDVLTKAGLSSLGKLKEPVSRTVVLDLVDDAVITPSKVTIFNHETNKVYLNITRGSGFFSIEVSDETKAKVEYRENMRHIVVIPIEDGSFTITVHDLCIEANELAVAEIQISGVETVVVKMIDKVELNKSVVATVQVLFSDMLPLPASLYPLLNLHPVSSSSSILSTKLLSVPNSDDLQAHYTVTGAALGQTALIFKIEPNESALGIETKGYSGRHVSSDPIPVQVFSPLRLSPRNITLVVGATFQVVCSGGPEAYSSIEYIIHDKNVASVTTAGILTASKLGNTIITARIIDIEKNGVKQVLYSQDTATVFVVPINGIKIHSPLRRLQTGTKMPIYAIGLNKDELPFAFGSAMPMLSIRWGLNNTEVVKLENMFKQGDSYQGGANNFATRVVALKPGQVTVTLEVWSTFAKDNNEMQMSSPLFKDDVAIQVFGELQLTKPDINEGTIVITTNTQLHLKSSRDSFARVSYKVETDKTKDPIVRLENKSLLVSGAQTGDATLTINAIDDYGIKQRKTIDIRVRNVAYLMATANTVARTKDHALSVLPFGWTSMLTVSAHDNIGIEFHATNVQLKFRPSRFDIIHVNEGIDNRTITVRACEQGQAVLKIWDSSNPSLADYVPVIVESAINPSSATVLEGDIICFSSSLVTNEGQNGLWNSDSSSILIRANSGVAVAAEPGSAFVDYSISEVLITKSKITVTPITVIEIQVGSSTVISNFGTYNVPILLKGSATISKNGKNCTSFEDSESLPLILPPFICRASFASVNPVEVLLEDVLDVSATFDAKTGHYFCRISPANKIPLESASLLEANLILSVEHKKGSFARQSSPISFIAAFHVQTLKLSLKDVKSIASLVISVTSKMAECIVAVASDPNALEIQTTSSRSVSTGTIAIPIYLRYCPSSSQQTILIKCPLTKQEVVVAVETCTSDSIPDNRSWTEQIKTITILVGTLVALYIGYRVVTGPKLVDVNGTGSTTTSFSPISPSGSQFGTRLWTVDNSFSSMTSPSPHRPIQQSPNPVNFSYSDYLQPR